MMNKTDDGDDAIGGDGDDDSNDDNSHDSNDDDGAIWKGLLHRNLFPQTFFRPHKGCYAGTVFPRHFSAPQTSTNLSQTFNIIGPTNVFVFSRNPTLAARLRKLSSGCFVWWLVP